MIKEKKSEIKKERKERERERKERERDGVYDSLRCDD